MTKTLDFTKKKYLNVVLDDGEGTKLRIMTPTKALAQEMDAVYDEAFNSMESADQYDAVYDLAADILRRNKEGVEVERKDVEAVLDVAEAWALINTYRLFTFEAMEAQAKN